MMQLNADDAVISGTSPTLRRHGDNDWVMAGTLTANCISGALLVAR